MRPLLALATLLALARPADAWWAWIEAERPFASNLSVRHAFAPANAGEADTLSGGAWVGADKPRPAPLFAVYDVDVPADGSYQLYARKFWKHGPYRVTVDGGQPSDVGDGVALLDATPIRQNLVVNWTAAGTFKLAAGRHRFRVESTRNDGAIAFDCFLLTDEPFTPRGKLRPDDRLTSDRPGWFAWDPPADAASSPIDLSSLNPPIEGPDARIVARDGKLVRAASGVAVRFWGVNVSADLIRQSDADLDRHAAFLARRGVNLVRIHSPIYRSEGNAGAIDADQLRNVQRAVAAFKRRGIYTTLSMYYPLWIKLDAQAGWPGYKSQNPFGLLFIDARFNALYRSWWQALLTTPDPTTHATLADEPAVLSLEIVNEDSLFFWTFKPYETVPAAFMEPLERRFAAWLAQRYGSARVAVAKWPAKQVRGDDLANDRVGIESLWQIVNERDARAVDTARFLYEVQRDFYAQTRAFLRDELRSQSLVTTSNWTTASERYLTPIERATSLAGDVVDRHDYYAGIHEGFRASSQLSAGDTYTDRTALRFEPNKPGEAITSGNPIFDTGYNDRPTMLSEMNWSEPNRYRAEMPWIAAAIGAAQDLDAMAFFDIRAAPGYEPLVGKFSIASPVAAGQFPAAALVYRLGLLDEAPVVVNAALRLDDLLKLEGGVSGLDGKVRVAGRTQTTIVTDADTPTSRPSVDVARYVDTTNRVVTSANGQVRWDWGRGLLTIDAPRVQAAVGFLAAAGPVRLGDVTIESPMEYGAIAVVPMDGRPIATSARLLVQAMSEQQNTGWKTRGEPIRTIESAGTSPVLVRELRGTVTFATPAADRTMQPVDASGHADPATPLPGPTLTLPATRPYTLITRPAPATQAMP